MKKAVEYAANWKINVTADQAEDVQEQFVEAR